MSSGLSARHLITRDRWQFTAVFHIPHVHAHVHVLYAMVDVDMLPLP